ncbi:MAG TPA: hypothetical protein VIL55_11995 [Naasia sp.]|jgi:putative membrane protein
MLTLLPAATAAAHWGGPGPGFGWWWLLVPLFWIAFFALLFTFLARRWRRGGGPGPWGDPRWAGAAGARSAETTLAERFAQGDIDETEYRARLEVLRANRETPPSR